jgi:Fic family protein
MAHYSLAHWEPAAKLAGLSRRDRLACDYRPYHPDRLQGCPVPLDGTVAADVADAERALAVFNARARALVDTEALARLLLRAESVASSEIEGLVVGARRLLRADVEQQLGGGSNDVTATEVLANIDAMTYGINAIRAGDVITVELLCEIHRRLLERTALDRSAGVLRERQNWIGGSGYNPCTATFVPPPPDEVRALLEDLCAFMNGDDLPGVAQAAIAHAQFETIHPFADGNGRVGRAAIHLVLRRRGLTPKAVPPISLVLATDATSYVDGLTRTRYDGPPDSPAAREGFNLWIGRFAAAVTRSVRDADAFEKQIDDLEGEWRRRVGQVRRSSATDILLQRLPAMPVLTVKGGCELIKRSFVATNEAISKLVDADVLRPVRDRRRNRAFEAHELVDLFTDFDRRLASPDSDTHISEPVRPVPVRH